MSYEFGRFGLQHIMAVSGFHFSVITGILSWLHPFFWEEGGELTYYFSHCFSILFS